MPRVEVGLVKIKSQMRSRSMSKASSLAASSFPGRAPSISLGDTLLLSFQLLFSLSNPSRAGAMEGFRNVSLNVDIAVGVDRIRLSVRHPGYGKAATVEFGPDGVAIVPSTNDTRAAGADASDGTASTAVM